MTTARRIQDRVDEVFSALDDGDRARAEERMGLVRRKGAESPERFLAEAEIARFDDDLDAAVDWLERAAAADPSWGAPAVERASLELDRDAPERALAMAEEVVARHADDAAVVERALLLMVEALAELDRDDDALDALLDLLEREIEDPAVLVRAGAHAHALGALDDAAEALSEAVDRAPDDADAWFALGAVFGELDALEGAVEAWLRVRELDAARPRPPWRLDDAEIEALAERTLRELPEDVREHLRDVPILVSDAPSEAQIRDGISPRLLGLFVGTPLTERGIGGVAAPDACHVFVRNLEDVCADRAELEDELRITILHETAHYFGLEDEDLEALGLG